MGKIIFLDMDGTLIYSSSFGQDPTMTSYTKKILKKVQEKGHQIFIASGRPYAFLAQEIMDFGFDGFVLANGSVVLYKGKYLINEKLKKDYVMDLINKCHEYNVEYILLTKDYSYLHHDYTLLNQFYHHCSVNFNYIVDEDPIAYDNTVKIELMPRDTRGDRFCKSLSNDEIAVLGESPYAYELFARKQSKAEGIKEVLSMLNIPKEDSIAFGDGLNDVEMFQVVGTSYAMGNASQEVQQYATDTCLSVEEDGVANKLRELFL